MSDNLPTISDRPAGTQQTPDRLMALAIERGADVDKLERLMDLQDRYNAQQAREAYFDALSRFQAEVATIPRGKEVRNGDGTIRYKYAPLDIVISTIKPTLLACGLSYRWETEASEDDLRVVCYVTHKLGHTESTSVQIPGIAGYGTNSAQDRGSAISYGKRYSLTNALGLQPEDDDDANRLKDGGHLEILYRMLDVMRDPVTLQLIACVKDNFADGGDVSAAAEAYAEFSKAEVEALWVAPSKGGVWTTEERKRIKSDSEFQKLVQARREDSDWHNRNANV